MVLHRYIQFYEQLFFGERISFIILKDIVRTENIFHLLIFP